MAGEQTNKGYSTISLISLALSVITLVLLIYLSTRVAGISGNDFAQEINLAGELADNNLFKASIDEYKKILAHQGIDPVTCGNINYLIGEIYFENVGDYENAAAYFIRARSINPKGSYYDEAGRNLIASLEKMGRMIDAKRELDRTVNIAKDKFTIKGDTILAKIGSDAIYQSDLNRAIQSLPPEIQKNYMDKKGKIEMLNQLVSLELMSKAAMREGFDREAEFAVKQKQIEKELLAQMFLTRRMMPQINIDTADVRNYYFANKREKYGDKSYNEIKTTVMMDYQQEKAQKAFGEYISRLAAMENMQVFEENIR
jgi:tetratricopeptide (TPR) repeat protein